MKLFEELKRRNVFRVAVGYIIAGWLALQVTDVVMGLLELPSWVGRLVFFAVLLGFPLALAFSWVFQLTPEGLRRDSEVEPAYAATFATGRKLDLAIIVLLVISLGYFVLDKFVFTASVGSGGPEVAAWYDKSIAVIPFEARGDEEEGGLFAQGIHDDLLTQLSKIADLHVISRTSVMEYAGTTRKIPEIGKELGVRHILEGGVQKVGDNVRINAELIDAQTDRHLWAETFDRALTVDNIFKVQSEIVAKITDSLHTTLLPKTGASIARAPTNNVEAYRDYTAARQGNFSSEVRIKLLESAIEEDPNFALAWVELARGWQDTFWFEGGQPDALEKSLDALRRAEAIDPDLPQLHFIRGVVAYHGFLDHEKALSELELAEQGLPGDSDIFMWRGFIFRYLGRLLEAIEALQRAVALDPRNASAASNLASTLSWGRYFEDARRVWESGITTFPDRSPLIRWMLAMEDWYQYGDSRSLLRVPQRPDWPATAKPDALLALSAWLADDMETAARHARLINPDDTHAVGFATPPLGFDMGGGVIEIVRAGILMRSGSADEARAILEGMRTRLTQEISVETAPPWSELLKLSLALALLGENERAAAMADDMVRRFNEEPRRNVPGDDVRAAHAMIVCHIGILSRAEADFRWVLSRNNNYTLPSLVNGWPPCRDKFKGTEHHTRLEQEFGHLSQGKTLPQ